MSSFAIYSLGTLIVIIGVIYICHLAHMPQSWMIGLTILLVGGGLIGAVNNTRQRDKS
jgi:protein-S-isoprenylcysteine O-methyltransferase Ste14